MNPIFDKAKYHFEQNLPFVIYRKPNQNSITGIFQNNDELNLVNDFSEKGFVFCSFDRNTNVIIPENQSETIVFENEFIDTVSNSKGDIHYDIQSKSNFENLVLNGISAIQNNEFQKVVVSRKELVILKKFDIISIFSKLMSQYQSALRYCFYHPKIGLWFGATPEQLLQVEDAVFKTVALAGTQKFENSTNVVWQEKEIQEQKIVTDFIIKNLHKSTSNIKSSEPFTVRAGNLVHIKSEISGILNSEFNIQKIIEILHPTPAVCGLPKEVAKKFIIKNENYNREFYTGFLGELNMNKKSDLFVNLRCMQIVGNTAHIYIGCGVTKDSVPEKEFLESVNKSMTMKIILDI
jgi:isochorismate synthase